MRTTIGNFVLPLKNTCLSGLKKGYQTGLCRFIKSRAGFFRGGISLSRDKSPVGIHSFLGFFLPLPVPLLLPGLLIGCNDAEIFKVENSLPSAPPLMGSVVFWSVTGIGMVLFFGGLLGLGRWARRYPMRDLVLISLMAGLAFLAVSLPGFFIRTFTVLLLGPFNFFAEGLVFKFLLFLMLGSLFSLVRRPGVFFIFYGLWMVAQALLNGHYSPITILFAGVTITLIEGALWLGGITNLSPGRRSEIPILRGALWVGFAEGVSVLWGLMLFKLLYRLYLPDWYVILQAGSEAAYAGIGTAVGLGLGGGLIGMRRPLFQSSPVDQGKSLPVESPRSSKKPALLKNGPLLEVENLTFGFPGEDNPIINNLNFKLNGGEIILLAGLSGSGKTTLLRLMKGLLPVSAPAKILHAGIPITNLSVQELAARTGLLFQEPALQVLRSTVEGEVSLGWKLFRSGSVGHPVDKDSNKVSEALSFFGLENLAKRATSNLSSGELQRTALASLLVQEPRVLLLDEPLAHLDDSGRGILLEKLKALAERGFAILISEHRWESLLDCASRVLWLKPEGLTWQGSPDSFRVASKVWKGEAISDGYRSAFRGGKGILKNNDREADYQSGKSLAEFRDVRFRYGKSPTPLLEGITAAILPGEAIALTGNNGAGKSTLLSLLLGLRKPQSGTIHCLERPPHRLSWPEKARLFAYLPQQADLILHAPTVREELGSALGWRGEPEAIIRGKVNEWLKRLGLAGAAERFPHLLSLGERLRLALGAVLIADPQFLILDEPFAGQDPAHISSLLGICTDFLTEKPGRCLIAATHDLASVTGFFDVEWRLTEGKVEINPLERWPESGSLVATGGSA